MNFDERMVALIKDHCHWAAGAVNFDEWQWAVLGHVLAHEIEQFLSGGDDGAA